MHSFLLSLIALNPFFLVMFSLLFIEWKCIEIGERLGPLFRDRLSLPPIPRLNRVLFLLFPETMNRLFPSHIEHVEVPEGVTNGEFDKPLHKRMWRKRFPELVEQWPKRSPRYKGWIPDDPLPGEFESPLWKLGRWWSALMFDLRTNREKKKRGRPATVAPKQVYFPFYG